MADIRHAHSRSDRIKPGIHRRCPHCKKTHISEGASKADVKRQGEFPTMLRVYVETLTKEDLIEIARQEGCNLSELVRRIIRGYLASRD